MKRRHFLIGSAVTLTGVAAGTAFMLRDRSRHGTLLSAFEDARGDQYVGGITLDTAQVFGAKVPARAHGCAIDPRNAERVLFFARRPGTIAYELRRDTMSVRTVLETPAGRHLAGHGLFSHDGELLFTPEHDYENERGKYVKAFLEHLINWDFANDNLAQAGSETRARKSA